MIPAVIGYIVYTVFFNLVANVPAVGDFLLPEKISGSGVILGVFEDAEKPLGFVLSSFSEERLPENSDKPTPPILLPDAEPLEVSAESAVVFDAETDSILFQKDIHKLWPIASITKLMTALVFLDVNPGWDEIYRLKREDRREGGLIHIFTGEKMTVKDLFYSSLVGSENTATAALASAVGLTEGEFVAKMNEKAAALGLENTFFYDMVGLKENYSTAYEIALFARIALNNEEIRKAALSKNYQFATIEGRKKFIVNTDDLIDFFPKNGIELKGGKTGYNGKSGYCFAGDFVNHENREIITVVLGANDILSRFEETKKLVDWVYENYRWIK